MFILTNSRVLSIVHHIISPCSHTAMSPTVKTSDQDILARIKELEDSHSDLKAGQLTLKAISQLYHLKTGGQILQWTVNVFQCAIHAPCDITSAEQNEENFVVSSVTPHLHSSHSYE